MKQGRSRGVVTHTNTESWLSPSILDNEIIPADFSLYRKDRNESRGGGVFLAVHQSIPSRVIPSPSSIEVVSVQINIPHPLVICVCHLTPCAPS